MRTYGAPATPFSDSDLTPDLVRANRGRDTIDEGWHALEFLEDGTLLARKGGAIRGFVPGEYLATGRGPSSRPRKDDPITVFSPKASLLTQPEMYFAFGEQVDESNDSEPLLRFYWNVTPAGAPSLVEQITDQFNRFPIPFRFKCPVNALQYPRRDAAVLYVHKRYAWPALTLVARVYQHVRATLDLSPDSTPLFARMLEPGLAFAEDPGGAQSFGNHRCRLLADALLDSDGDQDPAARLRARFERERLSLQRPWLNRGSEDIVWPPPHAVQPGPRSVQGGYLETAARIGARICRAAFWYRGQCNWTSDLLEDGEIVHEALDGSVYKGSSGIALFLSRLERATAEPIFGQTARAAIEHSLSTLSTEPSGLYSGASGALLAAAEIRGDLDESHLLRIAQPLSGNPDLLHGCAGMIIALLSACRRTAGGSRALLEQAVRNGEWLIENADRGAHGCSWALTGIPRNLTGFSHGAAGIGWALAELYSATGDSRFSHTALEAFRYERSLFDPTKQNWPDLREEPIEYLSVWCHGAGGIALSRLRALALLPEDSTHFATELQIALDATGRKQFEDWCLCHGVAGNADILLSAGRRAQAERVAEEGIERFDRRGVLWPCLVDSPDECMGLMLGVAGVGHFYLRLADPQAPSVLLWE